MTLDCTGACCRRTGVWLLEQGFCGSWHACDAGNTVCQLHRGDAIAGKPAPTVIRFPREDSSESAGFPETSARRSGPASAHPAGR
ncbi:hypothetical protein DCC84_27365 [Pseudomonas sp. SXM-1]|nr:hypothetical protein DCC84_27365 [Pseudomonas sp. SXM-1]